MLGYDGISESAIAVFIRDKTHYVKMLQAMKKHFRGKLKKKLKESHAKSKPGENLLSNFTHKG